MNGTKHANMHTLKESNAILKLYKIIIGFVRTWVQEFVKAFLKLVILRK
jgi:hypothetical protein